MSIYEALRARALPVLPETREEMLTVLQQEEYGFVPPPPLQLQFEAEPPRPFAAGKATLQKVRLQCTLPGGTCSFPIYAAIPHKAVPCPAFVLINFSSAVPDPYYPAEEILDRGYAVFSFFHGDVTTDDPDMENNLAGAILGGKPRDDAAPGKIALWAWAAMRTLDYALTLQCIDSSRIAVVGHSRLGKTALLAGALDERFSLVISNDSGCGGAALFRGKVGERIEQITNRFPFWFCPRFRQYAGREEALPFDQHFLLSAIAPRALYVASAQEDTWADPTSEYLGCVAAAPAFERFGKDFIHPDGFPRTGQPLHEGRIGYHRRAGTHYLSREDWNLFMDFFDCQRA